MLEKVLVEKDYLEDLEQVRQEFKAILEASPNGVIATDLSGHITHFNARAERILQTCAHGAIGKDLARFCSAETHRNYQRIQEGVLITGEKTQYQTEWLTSLGNTVSVEVSLNLTRNNNGEPVGWCHVIHDISSMKEKELQIQRNEGKMQSIFRAARIGIGVTSERVLIEVNDTFCEMIGYTREELVGQNARILYPTDEDFTYVGEEKYRQIERSGTGTVETTLKCKDDSIIDVIMSSTPFDQNDYAKGITFTVLDITALKKAEMMVVQSEEYFRSLMERLPVGVAIYDLNGTLEKINEAFKNMWDLSNEVADAIVGKFNILKSGRIDDLLLRTFIDRAFSGEVVHLPAVMTSTVEFLKEIGIDHLNTDSRWVAAHFYPQRTRDGKLQNIISVYEDVTSHIEAEQQLASRAGTLNAIFNSTPAALMVVDENFRVEKINHHGTLFAGKDEADILGTSSGKALGCHFASDDMCDCGPECQNCPLKLRVEHTFTTGGSHRNEQMEMAFVTGDRTYNRNLLISTALIEVEGLDRVLLSLTDVSAVKKKDIALKKEKEKRDKLEHQFRQAQKMESIGRLAGGVAHDLNNLLSPILGYGDILLEDLSEEDPRHESARQIVSAGQRASDLVRQLLAFSRKQTLDYKKVDVNTLYENFGKLLRRTIREDIEIKTKFSPSLPLIKGDIGQLEQVVMNLSINAQDAMPEGGVLHFETAVARFDDEFAESRQGVVSGNYVKLSITDNGDGMSEETQSRIFEPFFTTKGKNEGTGLGLATVYGIVKQHGGNIWCYSEPGNGTTFNVYFPVIEEKGEADLFEKQELVSPYGSGEIILVVEDNDQLRNMAGSVLSRKGYRVLKSSGSVEALNICRERGGTVNLLLTDIVMPEMNGKELADKLTAEYENIRVLFMSGYPDDILSLQSTIGDETSYIQKPFTVNGLLHKIRETLDG